METKTNGEMEIGKTRNKLDLQNYYSPAGGAAGEQSELPLVIIPFPISFLSNIFSQGIRN